jgi:pSer/pThr/pTyr-binding forkhead associated (FHA) protein
MGVIEVLNRSGQVTQRVSYSGGVFRIGRAYDNDVIVGDPYVCAHHLALESTEGKIVARDLESLNGSYHQASNRKFSEVALADGDVIQFGHSQLRFRSPGAPVAATWQDSARHGLLSVFDNPLAMIVSVLLAIAVLIADTVLETVERVGPGLLANELFYPLIGLLLWAGIWALLNRIITHRSNLHVHLAIASTGLVAIFLFGHMLEMLGFGLGLDPLVPYGKAIERILVLSLALYAHLGFATHGTAGSRAALAGVVGILLVGVPTVSDILEQDRFNTLPELDPLLKPPAFQLRQGMSPERFFRDAEALQREVDADVD